MAVKQNVLDSKNRILIGAIGGISPIIISLLVVDVVALYNETGLMDGIGLAIRFLVLVFIGGLWVICIRMNTNHSNCFS